MENPNATPEQFPRVKRARSEREIDVFELKRRRDGGTAPLIVDCRESHELEIAALSDVIHLPISRVESDWRDLLEGKEDEEIALL